MLKYWFALVIVLGLAFVVARQDQHAADQAAQKAANQSKTGAISVPAATDEQHPQEDVHNPNGDGPRWYPYYALGLSLFRWPVGTGSWAIILTLLAIAEQTSQTRKAADAALLNSQAIVNSERAWLVAEAVRDECPPFLWRVQIANHGRTPARFIRGDATHTLVESPDLLPIPPVYDAPMLVPKQTLIATDKGFAVPHGYEITHLVDQPGTAGKTLVIYGRVVYGDTITPGVEHETRWCFALQGGVGPQGDFCLTGPEEYTSHS